MKRVLITGGGTGIGRATAHVFADEGYDVTIAGRRLDALEDAAKGHNITVRTADVTDEASVAALFEHPYDIVIANAGSGVASKVADTTLAQWNTTLSVNLTGTFLTFREALRDMPAGGRLIAIASTASLKGGANIAAYSAAKHGVLGLVRSLAQEVAKRGLTCNAICPGFVDTDMAETAITGVMARFDIDREKATKMVVSGNPQGRLIDPLEVANTALWLASDTAKSVNGHALSLNGGEV